MRCAHIAGPADTWTHALEPPLIPTAMPVRLAVPK